MMEVGDSRPRRSKAFIYPEAEFLFEKERLLTFIDWPVSFISPEELAKEGFYYLRNEDHCACVFCKRIIGHWVLGDTPKGEHLDKSPQCLFARGEKTKNIPCLLYTSDAADERSSVDLGGRRI